MLDSRRLNNKKSKFINCCLPILFSMLILNNASAQIAEKSVETQIADYIESSQPQQLSLLEKLVNINSGTANIAGVYKVGELLRSEFQNLDFKVRWVKPPATMHRAGTLIAEHPSASNKGKKLLLLGHLDTVFAKNSSFQQFKRDGNIATGPGVIDIKGGDVIILTVLNALKAADVLKDADITVVLTGDEEDTGVPIAISRKALIDIAKTRDVALDFEFALDANTATTARRGISLWEIKTKSDSDVSHSAKIFEKESGYGAIFELTRVLDTIRTQLSDERYLTINPGVILGGTEINYDKKSFEAKTFGKENVIAKSAIARGDVRFLSEEQLAKAKEKMTEIVATQLPGTSSSIIFHRDSPPMALTQANTDLLEKYSEESMKLGYGPVLEVDPGARGAGDISHIAAIVPASLAGLGAHGTGAHSEKESLDIQSLIRQSQRAAMLVYRLIKDESNSSS